MTKHTEVCKPTEGREQVEEGTTTSGKNVRTVGKLTGKTPGTQNVRDVTKTVTEKRTMEEIPPSTWEQVLQRCEVCLRYFTKSLHATVFMQMVYSTVVRGNSDWVCDKGVNWTNIRKSVMYSV